MTLDDFAGTWRLSRQIEDHRAGTRATLNGQAEFVAQDDGLTYHENGLLHLPQVAPIKTERTYHWRTEGACIAVMFEDGRPFHAFSLSGASANAQHWCDPDTYKVAYAFHDWPEWTSEWRVTGPRKDYVMVSAYRRM